MTSEARINAQCDRLWPDDTVPDKLWGLLEEVAEVLAAAGMDADRARSIFQRMIEKAYFEKNDDPELEIADLIISAVSLGKTMGVRPLARVDELVEIQFPKLIPSMTARKIQMKRDMGLRPTK